MASPPDCFARDPRVDLDAMERVAAGDERAFAALYDRFAGLAYSLAAAILRDSREAEEAVSDAFTQIWRTAHAYDATKGTLQAWVVTVVRSRALDRLRSRRRAERFIASPEAAAESIATAATDPADGPDWSAEASERRTHVEAALASLPANQREALRLAYFEGLSQSEIAERLHEPLGTVKTRVRAALGKLRSLLAPLRDREEV